MISNCRGLQSASYFTRVLLGSRSDSVFFSFNDTWKGYDLIITGNGKCRYACQCDNRVNRQSWFAKHGLPYWRPNHQYEAVFCWKQPAAMLLPQSQSALDSSVHINNNKYILFSQPYQRKLLLRLILPPISRIHWPETIIYVFSVYCNASRGNLGYAEFERQH